MSKFDLKKTFNHKRLTIFKKNEKVLLDSLRKIKNAFFALETLVFYTILNNWKTLQILKTIK